MFAAVDLPADAVVEVAPVRCCYTASIAIMRARSLDTCSSGTTAIRRRTRWRWGRGRCSTIAPHPSCRYVHADDDLTIARLTGDICGRDLDNHLAPALGFLTRRGVRAGEELTIGYSGCGEEAVAFPD